MSSERLLHCSALLLVNLAQRAEPMAARRPVLELASRLKRRYENRPLRGYRDEEPGTGVFCGLDAGITLGGELQDRGFEIPERQAFDDVRRDVCFHLKCAPGRRRSSDPKGTRYELIPYEVEGGKPLDFFCRIREEVMATGLFDSSSEIFLIGARPLAMIEMSTVLQPHDFTDAFPELGIAPVAPQSDNLLFVQLQDENLLAWIRAGGPTRRQAMGGWFTSRVLAPGDSYAIELKHYSGDFDPSADLIHVTDDLVDDPMGIGYLCRIHDGFVPDGSDYPITLRESFLPGIEQPDIVARFCPLREAEMAAIKFPHGLETIRISRGGATIVEVPLSHSKASEFKGLTGEVSFDPDIPKLTVRLPFFFFPDIELPRILLERGVVVEWINEHRQEARHTISYWPQNAAASHRAQALRVLAGRLRVNAPYLAGRRARAGMDNIVVYRDDFHLETAERLLPDSKRLTRRGPLAAPFNSVFTGRTPDTADALDAFVKMIISLFGDKRKTSGSPEAAAAGPPDSSKASSANGSSPNGIAPFVATRYSLVFKEPAI